MKSKEKINNYKPAEHREKDLKLALLRIQKGRTRTGELKVTIAAVAREAGVSTALIHNHYPRIAMAIREAQPVRGNRINGPSQQSRDASYDQRHRRNPIWKTFNNPALADAGPVRRGICLC